MKLSQLIATGVLSVTVSAAFAGAVSSLVKASSGTTDAGEEYTVYEVSCKNKSTVAITEYGRKYCVGDMGTEICARNKIKIASKACKIK